MKSSLFWLLLTVSSTIAVACQSTPPTVSSPSSPQPTAATTSTQPEGANFDEELYAVANPDVKKLIQQGQYKSGLDHYIRVGQTTKKPNGEDYESFFTGTQGNDTVRGVGKGKAAHFSGVKIEIVPKKGAELPLRPQSLGKGEKDRLVGTPEGGSEFLLGSFITSVNPKAEPFYVGNGNADYATIQNFTKAKDAIILAGQPKQYKFETKNGTVHISTIRGDLVAIVEGVDKLTVGEVVKKYGIFTLK